MGNPHAPASTAGRPLGPRQKSGSWRAGPTCAAHFSIVSQPGGGPSAGGVVGLATSKHGPDDPCVLVGDGNRGPVEATPPVKLVDPCVEGVCLPCSRADDGSRAMHEQGSQALASALRDAEEDGALTARVLARDEPDPGGEVTSVLELRAIPDCGDDGGGGLGTDTLDAGDPLAVFG